MNKRDKINTFMHTLMEQYHVASGAVSLQDRKICT